MPVQIVVRQIGSIELKHWFDVLVCSFQSLSSARPYSIPPYLVPPFYSRAKAVGVRRGSRNDAERELPENQWEYVYNHNSEV